MKLVEVFLPDKKVNIKEKAFSSDSNYDVSDPIIIAKEGYAKEYAEKNKYPFFEITNNKNNAAPVGTQFIYAGIRYRVTDQKNSKVEAINYHGTGTGKKEMVNPKDYNGHQYYVEKICYNAFGWSKISILDLRKATSLKTIDRFAFEWSKNLTTIYIPSNVEKIDETALECCDNIKYIYGKGTAAENLAKSKGLTLQPLPNDSIENNDKTPPSGEVKAFYINSYKNIEFRWNYSDISGIKKWKLYKNGKVYSSGNNAQGTKKAYGNATYTFKITDNNNNTRTTTFRIDEIDENKPTINITKSKKSIIYIVTDNKTGDKGIKKVWVKRLNVNTGKYEVNTTLYNKNEYKQGVSGVYYPDKSGKYILYTLDASGRTSKSKIYLMDLDQPKIVINKNKKNVKITISEVKNAETGIKKVWFKKLKAGKYEIVYDSSKIHGYFGKEKVFKKEYTYEYNQKGKYQVWAMDFAGHKKSKIFEIK